MEFTQNWGGEKDDNSMKGLTFIEGKDGY